MADAASTRGESSWTSAHALFRAAGWVVVGSTGQQGSTVVTNIVLGRTMGPTGFGEFAAALSLGQVTMTVLALGVPYLTTKYVAELRVSQPQRAGRILGIAGKASWVSALVAGLLLFSLATPLARLVYHQSSLGSVLLVAAPIALLGVRNLFLTGALMGLGVYRSVGVIGLASGGVYVCACVVGQRLGGPQGALLGASASMLFQVGVGEWMLQRQLAVAAITPRVEGWRVERGLMLHFALPGLLSSLTAAPALWLVQVAIARSPAGLGGLGLYVAALNLAAMSLFLPQMLNSAAMPLLNERVHDTDSRAYNALFRTNRCLTLALASLFAAILLAGAPQLLEVFGASFVHGARTLRILALALWPEALTIATNQVLQSRGRMWTALAAVSLPRDAVLAALAWTLAPRYGAEGAAWAYVVARTVAAIAIVLVARRDRIPVSSA